MQSHGDNAMVLLDSMEEFKSTSVKIKDPERVERLIRQFIDSGKDALQVIADFDFTLSRFHKNGNRCISCHGALSSSPLMPKEYGEQAEALFKRYHPVELNLNMTLAEKAPIMKEWWDKAHQTLANYPLNKSDVKALIQSSNVALRDGCREMIEMLHHDCIPLMIMSAGLGDLLEEVVRQQAGVFDNITTISNFMKFDENGVSCGFHGETIHICNKNVSRHNVNGDIDNLAGRRNALLLGDSMGDLNMAEGIDNIENILKIGFLNQNIDESLNQYMDGYDVVLVDDQSVDLVNSLLRKIIDKDP